MTSRGSTSTPRCPRAPRLCPACSPSPNPDTSPSAPTGPSRRSVPARYSPQAWKPTPDSPPTPVQRSSAPTRSRCFRASGQQCRHIPAQHSIRYVTQQAERSCEWSCDSSTSGDTPLAQGLLPGQNAFGQLGSGVFLDEVAGIDAGVRLTGRPGDMPDQRAVRLPEELPFSSMSSQSPPVRNASAKCRKRDTAFIPDGGGNPPEVAP